MAFDNIRYLWLLLSAPVLFLLSVSTFRTSNRWLFGFARERRKWGPFVVRIWLLAMAVILVVVSLAGPKVQVHKVYFNRSGLVVAMGIDVSKSMLAEDASFPPDSETLFPIPNRLNRARYVALELLSLLHGERVGIFMFANQAIEIVPFTRDYGYCRYVLKHISDVDIVMPGSNLAQAIRAGIAMLEGVREKGARIMILISDGEDISLDKSLLYESARQAAEKGVRIYTVGVGTVKEALLPIRSPDGASIRGYYLDQEGSYLRSSLVPETLKQIAAAAGGRYFWVSQAGASEELMEAVLEQAKTLKETRSVELAWLDLSVFFMGGGLLCSLLGGLLYRW
jgi:Ca-activated chloride channel family protein